MREMWARIRNFRTRNPIWPATIALALVLGIGAIVLLAREISYIHPGPAIAAGMLVIVVLFTGLAINASIEQLQEKPTHSLPFVIGLDVLVEH